MVELGQSLFGNKWETVECPRYVEDGIYALAEEIGNHDEDQMHGYGHEFENAIFEMHPYFWGDCECGFEELDWQWSEDNPHDEKCYQSELDRRGYHDYDIKMTYDERSAILHGLRIEWGLPEQGCAVYCNCGHDESYHLWREENDHAPTCRVVLPNFRHKPTGFSVHWYKYMGRSQTMDREMSSQEWKTIRRECEDSLV